MSNHSECRIFGFLTSNHVRVTLCDSANFVPPYTKSQYEPLSLIINTYCKIWLLLIWRFRAFVILAAIQFCV